MMTDAESVRLETRDVQSSERHSGDLEKYAKGKNLTEDACALSRDGDALALKHGP